jgi:hypothetical protein
VFTDLFFSVIHLSEGQAGEASESFKQGNVFFGVGEELDGKKLFLFRFSCIIKTARAKNYGR